MPQQLNFDPNEMKYIALASVRMMEDVIDAFRAKDVPWTPASKKDLMEMILAGTGVLEKLKRLGFDTRPLDNVTDEEMKNYVTKKD